MAWTQTHADLLNRYAGRFGLPALDADSAREWTRRLAEQFKFSFPLATSGVEWDTKSTSPTSPQSTDVICTLLPFHGYDVLISQGSPSQHLDDSPGVIDLTHSGQNFIAVSAANHLVDAPPRLSRGDGWRGNDRITHAPHARPSVMVFEVQ